MAPMAWYHRRSERLLHHQYTYRPDDHLWSQGAGRYREKRLTFDHDGDIFSLSLLTIEGGTFEANAAATDIHLGGNVSESRLAKAPSGAKHKVVLTANSHATHSLQTVCEYPEYSLLDFYALDFL